MSEYTKGHMQPGTSMFQGREVFTAVPDGNEEKIVAMFGFCGAEDEAESVANARRFCAVWNYCKGFKEEYLEQYRDDPSDLITIALNIMRKRDKVLESLSAARMHIAGESLPTKKQAIELIDLAVYNLTT